MNQSVWSDTVSLPEFSCLDGDIQTEVLIVGGGMAGILLAFMLDAAGVDYILVEAETICSGVTKNTTAKITSQHGLIYAKLTREFGPETAKLYLEANQAALQQYREICQDIACDYEEKDAFVYSLNNRKKLEQEAAALHRIGSRAELVSVLPLPFPVAGAVKFKHQAQFHPLKFVAAISKGLRIYEHTKVIDWKDHTALTNRGRIKADKVVVATHFPVWNKHGSYFLKQYQYRSYVMALEHAPFLDGMYVDEADQGMSFRSYEDLLLIGGGGHRTGKKGGCWQALTAFAERYYPAAKEKYRWAAQDCMTLDQVPYIGNYSGSTQNCYVATGFNKWGMTASMVAAMVLSDLVTGKENRYAPVFSPSRTMLRPQLAVNAFEATVSLLTPTTKRCPHLGCALKWNQEEHSWDCACHGSRFTKDGKLIDNPATGDIKQ